MVYTVLTGAIKTAVTATIAVPDSLAFSAAITLIVLLAIRELAGAYGGSRLKFLRRFLLMIIIPLLFVFALIVITRIMDIW